MKHLLFARARIDDKFVAVFAVIIAQIEANAIVSFHFCRVHETT
jgi:hypothetical protein